MAYIESIKIKDELNNYKFEDTREDTREDILSNISKLNIFIGSNNSGKSRFLRELYINKEIKFNINHKLLNKFNNLINEINEKFYNELPNNVIEVDNFNKEKGILKPEDFIIEKDNKREKFLKTMDELKMINSNSRMKGYNNYSTNYTDINIVRMMKKIGQKYEEKFNIDEELNEFLEKKEFKRIYIPILRGLRKLSEDDVSKKRTDVLKKKIDVLKKRTIEDYFKNNDEIEIFTGQGLYDEILKLLCGDFKDRNHLREFEKFLGDSFFDGKEVVLIPKIGCDVVYVKIGDEKEYPIYDLGDGIQSIIILTFNLFSNKGKDVLFFIEEPELYLHPGLQRKLIEIFLSEEFNTYQYFITSHSNHILDLTIDINNISVYKFMKKVEDSNNNEKQADFIIENVKNDDTSILQVLGVNNSSIFLSNCTIWIEGITDRLYIRKYLEIYQKDKFQKGEISKIYSEDIHYSFLEYSGGNITHWDFLDDKESMKHDRICNKIFLIADSDGRNIDENDNNKDDEKQRRLKKLKECFGERFYCLNAKEIENILTPHIIKDAVCGLKDGRVKDSEKDQDGQLFSESEFSIEDYRKLNLGQFIDNEIDKQINKRKSNDKSYNYEKRKTFSKGNTIAKKVDFCKYAVENMKSIDDMSKDAIELCEKIYNFIKENN